MGRETTSPLQPRPTIRENVRHLDHARLNPARQGCNLAYATPAVVAGGRMNDEVDAARHRGHDEIPGNVLPRQQRKGAELGHGLPGTVRMQGGHRRHAAIHGDQQVKRL